MSNSINQAYKEANIVTVFAGIILLLAIIAHCGGYLHYESSAFILNYTAERPFWNIIFDPDKNDWGCYQCRELSYIFDYIDAHIVLFFLKNKLIWFVSPISICLMIFCIWLQQYAGRRLCPNLPSCFFTFHAIAMALLPFFTENIFFRSSKPLVAASIGVLIFGTALAHLKRPGVWGNTKTLAIAALVAVLSDRQGVFFVTAFAGVLAIEQFFHPFAVRSAILKISISTVLISIVANVWIVPPIIEALNGYFPNFSYQTDFVLTPFFVIDGFKFTMANLSNVFTGINFLSLAIPVGVAFFCLLTFLLKNHKHISPFLFIETTIIVIVCAGIMTSRHAALMDEKVMFSGYFMPSMMIFSFFYLIAMNNLPEKLKKWIYVLPILAIVLRLYPYIYPEMLFIEDDDQKIYQDATIKLKHVIKNPEVDHKMLTLPYRVDMLIEKLPK
jgi:hypothetical protein